MSMLWQNLAVSLLTLSTSAVAYVGSFSTAGGALPAVNSDQNGGHVEARLGRAADGLFHVAVTLDGITTDAILDTGASRSIIAHEILGRLGREASDADSGGGAMHTINGKVRFASVPITRLQVEGFELGAIDAVTVKGSTAPTVLGQDAIARFASVTFAADELILR